MSDLASMQNQVVLITGATGGIGRVAAAELTRMGARVTMVGRNPQKTARAAAEIARETGHPAPEYLIGDLSLMSGVRAVADAFRAKHDRLDVLVNNAGAFFWKHEVTAEGYEKTFALNHLNYFLLTNLLLDLLVKSSPARIVNVSSAAHFGGRINLDDLNQSRGFNGWAAYSQSKLANVLFTYELSRRLDGTGVTANALHPGFVATNFGRSNGGLLDPIFRLTQIFAIPPEQGAQTTIYLASSPEAAGVTGKYFDRCQPVPSSRLSYDEKLAGALWEKSLALTGLLEQARQ